MNHRRSVTLSLLSAVNLTLSCVCSHALLAWSFNICVTNDSKVTKTHPPSVSPSFSNCAVKSKFEILSWIWSRVNADLAPPISLTTLTSSSLSSRSLSMIVKHWNQSSELQKSHFVCHLWSHWKFVNWPLIQTQARWVGNNSISAHRVFYSL